jgi:hypothetical protein
MKTMTNLSPNRQRLAALIAERETASAELATLTARSQRLARASAEIAPLESELIALNSAESGAMLAWANADDGTPAPVADAKRRARIDAKIATARASARAADGATVSVQSQAERVGARLRSLAQQIEQAAARIVTEDSMTLFSELRAGIAALEALKSRIDGARRFMTMVTEPPPGQAVGSIRLDFESFDRELAEASARPFRPMVPDMGEWMSLAAALKADPAATMESVS